MTDRKTALRADVEALCSEPMAGRKTGSIEGKRAREWIAAAFADIGLTPGASDGYVQPLPSIRGGNVLGKLEVEGATRTIIVSAHFDHLGRAGDGQAYWGADDNAAAVAIVLDVARRLVDRREELGRNILFAAWDAEEPPFFASNSMGSQYWTRDPTVPLDTIDTMICMDLMGHALGHDDIPDSVRGTFFVLGAERSAPTVGAEVDRISAEEVDGHARRLGIDVVPPLSDYLAFMNKEVPFLFLTCGRWAHYHATTDTPDRLDFPKIGREADFLTELTAALSNHDGPVAYRPEGRDDATSVASLRAMGDALDGYVPGIQAVKPLFAKLDAELAARGELSPDNQELVKTLVGLLESQLES